ncbi:DUF2141 domain-containing protein [Mucilaginibacter sp. UR6-1]|uniref:DUF2141 domain-containing protein n=1 Tax=Mucilaginibacter sp. UR6-1 TaxID=1435643 RepID=UPI001E3CF37D|nr:DUF2141 domain-containing protein [Mucilaginibacter sp. UR6-1]MCC8408120.1 DUF2141 domain-containing protein [Mucilaginibacter sp. UR6-1]
MKKRKFNWSAYFVIVVLTILYQSAFAQQQEIGISNLRSEKGKVILNVFKDQATYEKQEPFKKMVFEKRALKAGAISVSISLPPGTYGITLVDDENDNGKIDKNFIGIPKEGFGFSNFFMEKMKRPKFDDFKVEAGNGQPINIKAKYM